MVNNVGTTTQVLSTDLGTQNLFATSDDITIIAGELGVGFLVFDSAGTLAVITSYTTDANFMATTYALSMDVESILSLDY